MKEFFLKQKKIIFLFLVLAAIALISGSYAKFGQKSGKINITSELGSAVQNFEIALQLNELTSVGVGASSNPSPAETNQPSVLAQERNNIQEEKTASSSESFLNPINVILVINEKRYEAAVPSGSAVLNLMEILKKQNKLDFDGKNSSGLGFFVEEINGIKNNPSANTYWIYYVNGEAAAVGISTYIIKNNDVIAWEYETP